MKKYIEYDKAVGEDRTVTTWKTVKVQIPTWKYRILRWAFEEEFDDMKMELLQSVKYSVEKHAIEPLLERRAREKLYFAEKKLRELGYIIEDPERTVSFDKTELVNTDFFEIEERLIQGKIVRIARPRFELKKL